MKIIIINYLTQNLLLNERMGLYRLQESHNQSEQTDGTCKDFNNQYPHKHCRVMRIRKHRRRAHNPHGNPTEQIRHTDGHTGPKQRIAGKVIGILGRTLSLEPP